MTYIYKTICENENYKIGNNRNNVLIKFFPQSFYTVKNDVPYIYMGYGYIWISVYRYTIYMYNLENMSCN